LKRFIKNKLFFFLPSFLPWRGFPADTGEGIEEDEIIPPPPFLKGGLRGIQ
jgi:hypothetical protein